MFVSKPSSSTTSPSTGSSAESVEDNFIRIDPRQCCFLPQIGFYVPVTFIGSSAFIKKEVTTNEDTGALLLAYGIKDATVVLHDFRKEGISPYGLNGEEFSTLQSANKDSDCINQENNNSLAVFLENGKEIKQEEEEIIDCRTQDNGLQDNCQITTKRRWPGQCSIQNISVKQTDTDNETDVDGSEEIGDATLKKFIEEESDIDADECDSSFGSESSSSECSITMKRRCLGKPLIQNIPDKLPDTDSENDVVGSDELEDIPPCIDDETVPSTSEDNRTDTPTLRNGGGQRYAALKKLLEEESDIDADECDSSFGSESSSSEC